MTVEGKAKVFAKNLIVIEKRDSFSDEASLRTAEYWAYKAYLAGYNEAALEIANTWISVEEEMPEHKKLVLVKGDESGDQIPFLLGWYYAPHWFVIGEEDINFGEVTHWKPITL